MTPSQRTKECRKFKTLFSILHLLCLFGPLFYFIPYAYFTGTIVNKISLSFSVIVAIILALISIVVDTIHRAGLHRCVMWTLIAGVLFCLQEIQVFIWIMCMTSIADELVFTKLREHYGRALSANKEIDRRA